MTATQFAGVAFLAKGEFVEGEGVATLGTGPRKGISEGFPLMGTDGIGDWERGENVGRYEPDSHKKHFTTLGAA